MKNRDIRKENRRYYGVSIQLQIILKLYRKNNFHLKRK